MKPNNLRKLTQTQRWILEMLNYDTFSQIENGYAARLTAQTLIARGLVESKDGLYRLVKP